MSDLRDWLHKNELEQYADAFEANDIDFDILSELTEHDLEKLRAHHQRDLLGFFDVIDLGGKIQSPQRHTEQEPEPGHDAVAIADARPRLSQVQLVGRALQIRGEPLAAADVA